MKLTVIGYYFEWVDMYRWYECGYVMVLIGGHVQLWVTICGGMNVWICGYESGFVYVSVCAYV